MVTEMHAISYYSCTERYLQKVTGCAFMAFVSYSYKNPTWLTANLTVYFPWCSHYLIIRSISIAHVSDLHCNYIATSLLVSNINESIITLKWLIKCNLRTSRIIKSHFKLPIRNYQYEIFSRWFRRFCILNTYVYNGTNSSSVKNKTKINL